MLGYSEAELMRLTSLDVTHADDRQSTIDLTERLFKGAISIRTQDKRYDKKNGEVIWGKVTASLIHLEDKPLYVAMIEDITERKRTEAALKQSEGRLRGLIEQAPIGITLVDRDHRQLKVNAAFCRMLGYSEAELMRLTSLDVTHADDRQLTIDRSEERRVGAISIRTQDKRYVKKNGEDIWGKVTASLIHLEDKPLYVAMIEDITERKRTEAALKQSEGRLRGLIEQAPIGITLVDRDYRQLKVNAAFCRMLGYSEAELMRLSSLDVTHADDRQLTINLTERLFKGTISIRTQEKRYGTQHDEGL